MEKSLEEMLICQCAPTFAGVKPANLFRCADEASLFRSVFDWNQKLQHTGICIRVIKRCRRTHACLIYVYHREWMHEILTQKETQDFLKHNDYDVSKGAEGILCQLSRRLCVNQDFPHEIGVFLGYPLSDVIGFIQNKGQNYSCCGHWKCYGDAAEAQKQFDTFHRCTSYYKNMYRQGVSLLQLVSA